MTRSITMPDNGMPDLCNKGEQVLAQQVEPGEIKDNHIYVVTTARGTVVRRLCRRGCGVVVMADSDGGKAQYMLCTLEITELLEVTGTVRKLGQHVGIEKSVFT